MRALLGGATVTHVPGIYDPMTAALAVRAGHRAVLLSGQAVSALALGRPDLGFGHATLIADRAAVLTPALEGIPLLADADAGFDEPRPAVWAALSYVRAGISGLHLSDRMPGRPGDSGLVGAGDAVAKISALHREVPALALVARTEAYASGGLPAAIDRCRQYARVGADAVLPAGLQDAQELAELHRALPGVPLVIDRSESERGGSQLPDADLAEVGVRLVLHPLAGLLAALRAVSRTYRAILDNGTPEPVDRLPVAAFTTLAGPSTSAFRTPAGLAPARTERPVDPDALFVPSRLQT